MRQIGIIIYLVFILSITSFSQIRLPKLISDGMVLQRDADVKIWGWATQHEQVTIQFLDSIYYTIADTNGNWNIVLNRIKSRWTLYNAN